MVGYLPLAPGTWGSLVGVAGFVALRSVSLDLLNRVGTARPVNSLYPQLVFVALELLVILVVTLGGIWAATQTERLLRVKDPGKVVIDEVAGQLIALLPLSAAVGWPWRVWVIVSFVLFRFFDIVKPYPARRLERLRGGLGIMLDDVVAGAYSAVVLSMLIMLFGFVVV
ncbi:MAG: phosphatidylglycerophosphatase A [Pyrinomonadaceae bacterium]